MDSEPFKRACKGAVSNKFIQDWNAELNDTQKNPLLRTDKKIKTEFTMEPYLDLVQNYRYHKAISSIRTSSRSLAVEYGRHHNIPLNMTLCHTCCMIDNEMHFIMNCKMNQVERDIFYSNMMQVDQSFMDLHATDMFVYVFSSRDPQILTWLGKLIHKSLSARNESQYGYPLTPLSFNTIDGTKNVYEIDDEKLYFYLKQYIFRMSSHEYIYIWRHYHLQCTCSYCYIPFLYLYI